MAPVHMSIDADGRSYTVSYQSAPPPIDVRSKTTGSKSELHIAGGGDERVLSSATSLAHVSGLAEGQYTYWFVVDGVREAKVSTLRIEFDQTAPQIYLQSPADGAKWPSTVTVNGEVLPGWRIEIDGSAAPIDAQGRFSVRVPRASALVLRATHPQRGIHYFVRHRAPERYFLPSSAALA